MSGFRADHVIGNAGRLSASACSSIAPQKHENSAIVANTAHSHYACSMPYKPVSSKECDLHGRTRCIQSP
jgi:hypothetical protein